MSFFPRSFVAHDSNPSSFHPLFRLLDDFDNYNRTDNDKSQHHRPVMKSFTPKFDVKEVGDVYELYGELPGIEQKDVEVEFTDATTLTVKGRSERTYTSGTTLAGALDQAAPTKAIEEASSSTKALQPSVEDEDVIQKPSKSAGNEITRQDEPKTTGAKYWVSERSVGEFARSFTFPVRVDQDNIHASMKNGILSIIVPKAKKVEARKITIN